jgi:hypothetical protein
MTLMPSLSRAAIPSALAAVLVVAAPRAAEPAPAGSPAPPSHLQVTRVFHLQGLEPAEAVRLLRSEVQVRRIATLRGRQVVVVSDAAERVDRSESLLRDRGAVARAVEPHAPLSLEDQPTERPAVATRLFRTSDPGAALALLRSIYQLRDAAESAEEHGVTVRAPLPVLEASAALLGELGLLAGAGAS